MSETVPCAKRVPSGLNSALPCPEPRTTSRSKLTPASISTVTAFADCSSVRDVTGVLHCFTGGPSLARAGLDLGFYVSLAGIITFPKAAELRETVRAVPVDRLLTETDSPFLAPVPHRGTRNEPAHVTHVAEALGALHGLTGDDLGRRAAANFHTLFRP